MDRKCRCESETTPLRPYPFLDVLRNGVGPYSRVHRFTDEQRGRNRAQDTFREAL